MKKEECMRASEAEETVLKELEQTKELLGKYYTLAESLLQARTMKRKVKQISASQASAKQFLKEEMKRRPLNVLGVKDLECLIKALRRIKDVGRQVLREAKHFSALQLEEYLGCIQERYNKIQYLSHHSKSKDAEERLACFLEEKEEEERVHAEESYQVHENFLRVDRTMQEYHRQIVQFRSTLAQSCLSDNIKLCVLNSISVDSGMSITGRIFQGFSFDRRTALLFLLSVLSWSLGMKVGRDTPYKGLLTAVFFFLPEYVLATALQICASVLCLCLSVDLSAFLSGVFSRRQKADLVTLHKYTYSYIAWCSLFQLGFWACVFLSGMGSVFLLFSMCSLQTVLLLERAFSALFVLFSMVRVLYLAFHLFSPAKQKYIYVIRWSTFSLYSVFLVVYGVFLLL
ncbi:hypothetical protein NECID01_0851 [Nematocida sp. AWRm77]|nr:hypothetical protein NECID01_0851 [Nematocida sp. AWRm77]